MYKLLFLALLSTTVHAAAKPEAYGTFTREKAAVVPLSTALASYKEGDKAAIHTEGTVKQVCEKKGCWMTLDDQGKSVRVFFKGYSFFVGKTLVGKKVLTEGVLHKKVQSVAEQKHLLEDGGASKADIEKIKEPLETFQLEATAVKTI